ncbi:MAG: ABC-type multidrug transport system, permease component, partial [Acidimicrobiia bacterium]|nr:ABC-type multidrug transport system, permease component [Acidimicrobiia bacterium]
MNPTTNAIRSGFARGWTEFKLSLQSPQDQGFYVFMSVLVLAYLWFNRNTEIEGTNLSYPTVVLPSMLGALLVFSLIIGPAYALAMEREDGTLLRAKAVPHGVVGHVTGHVVLNVLSILPSFLIILIPAALLFDGLMQNGAKGWTTVAWVTLLGLWATLPIGIIIGSLAPSV